eukprot:14683-Heterococcus_DN1.PRE.1
MASPARTLKSTRKATTCAFERICLKACCRARQSMMPGVTDNCPAHAKHSKHGIASCVVNEKGEACKNIKWAHNNTPLCFDECKGKHCATACTHPADVRAHTPQVPPTCNAI